MAGKPQNLLTWLAAVFALITLLISVVFFSWWALQERLVFGDDKFDTVRWMLPHAAGKPCARGDMVRDLRQNLLQRGMSNADVSRLLGRPDWEDGSQIEYELGVCLWVVHGLRLYFSPEGTLLHSAIVRH